MIYHLSAVLIVIVIFWDLPIVKPIVWCMARVLAGWDGTRTWKLKQNWKTFFSDWWLITNESCYQSPGSVSRSVYLLTTDCSSANVLNSHWSRNVEARLSLAERIIVLLRQLFYAIKIGGFHARKGLIIGALMPLGTLVGGFACPSWFYMA